MSILSPVSTIPSIIAVALRNEALSPVFARSRRARSLAFWKRRLSSTLANLDNAGESAFAGK